MEETKETVEETNIPLDDLVEPETVQAPVSDEKAAIREKAKLRKRAQRAREAKHADFAIQLARDVMAGNVAEGWADHPGTLDFVQSELERVADVDIGAVSNVIAQFATWRRSRGRGGKS